jgi:hypothetical protein
MKLKFSVAVIAITALFGWRVCAQNYDTNGDYVQTFAGSGFSGDVNGVGMLTMFNGPNTIVADSHSNLFFWDSGNYKIKEIKADGTVTTFAGGGNQTTGVGTNVNFNSYYDLGGLTVDHNDTFWAYSTGSSYSFWLYKISSDATVTYTNLGSIEEEVGIAGDNSIQGLCVDSTGNIYLTIFSSAYNSSFNKVYRFTTNGTLTVFVGSGNKGYVDGNGIFTDFNNPTTLACDEADNIYVWDSGNDLIRRIDQSQNVTTFAGKYQNGSNVDGVGTNAAFNSIYQMCFDNSGNLYLACGSCIRKIDATTNVVTLAGSFTQTGYINGAGNLARFNGADGVCIAGGTIYVADSSNQRIRSITNNPTAQVVSPANLQLNTYLGLQIIGTVGRTYQIQTSPDLNSWSTRATILLNSSPYIWIDQNPVSGNKFYRALLLP